MAPDHRVNPKSFFGELKRRNVYKLADRNLGVLTVIKHLRAGN
jgi:hypothetical protein